MEEHRPVLNIIGGKHTMSQDFWTLSLVRKSNADHAYLIVEGIDEHNERIIMDAHLVVKKGSHDKKADIVYRDISHKLDELQKIGASCASYTWAITRHQVDDLMSLIQDQKQKAAEDKINYILFGKSQTSGMVGVSLSDDAKASLGTHSDNASMDALLRDGHNCGSWAIAMVRALQLPFNGHYVPFFLNIPRLDIQGTHEADKEPDSRCLVM